jgi:hypothetical protein
MKKALEEKTKAHEDDVTRLEAQVWHFALVAMHSLCMLVCSTKSFGEM